MDIENVKSKLKQAGILVGILALGAALGRFALPSKIEEKEKIVYKDRIVEKQVETKETKKKNNINTTTTTTIKPDGTKTVETKTSDTSETEIAKKTDTDTTKDSTLDKSKETTTSNEQNNYFIAISSKLSVDAPNMILGGSISRRVVGPVYVGMFGYADKTYGLQVGLGF